MKFLITLVFCLFFLNNSFAQRNEFGEISYKLKHTRGCDPMSVDMYIDINTNLPYIEIVQDCLWGSERIKNIYNVDGLKLVGDQVKFHGSYCGKVFEFNGIKKVDRPMYSDCFFISMPRDFNRIMGPRDFILFSYEFNPHSEIIYQGRLNAFNLKHKIEVKNNTPVIIFYDRATMQEDGRFSSPDLIYSNGLIKYKGITCGLLDKDGQLPWERHLYMNCRLHRTLDRSSGVYSLYLVPKSHNKYMEQM